MKKGMIILLAVITVLSFVACGGSKSPEEAIIGTWKLVDMSEGNWHWDRENKLYTFTEDGTVFISMDERDDPDGKWTTPRDEGPYYFENGKLVIECLNNFRWDCTIKGKTMTLTSKRSITTGLDLGTVVSTLVFKKQ